MLHISQCSFLDWQKPAARQSRRTLGAEPKPNYSNSFTSTQLMAASLVAGSRNRSVTWSKARLTTRSLEMRRDACWRSPPRYAPVRSGSKGKPAEKALRWSAAIRVSSATMRAHGSDRALPEQPRPDPARLGLFRHAPRLLPETHRYLVLRAPVSAIAYCAGRSRGPQACCCR